MKWLANGVTAHPPPPSFSGPQLRRNRFAQFHWGRNKKGGKQNNSIDCMSDDDDFLEKSKGKHRKAKLKVKGKKKKNEEKATVQKAGLENPLAQKFGSRCRVFEKRFPVQENLDSSATTPPPPDTAHRTQQI